MEQERYPQRLAASLGKLKASPGYQRFIEIGADDVIDPGEDVELEPCTRCKGAGFLRYDVPVGHENFGKLAPCSCELGQRARVRAQERIWESAKIPKEFSGYTLESYARKFGKRELVAELEAWEGSGAWLVLTGPVGLGKSGLACVLLHRALKRGESGHYVVAPDVLSRIYATFGRQLGEDEPDEWQIMKSLETPDVLVLDDFVVGGKTLREDAQERFWRLIDKRYAERRVTIVTTNVPWNATKPGQKTMRDYLWEQTWDRLRGRAEIKTLTGVSQRSLDDITPTAEELEELPW